MNIKNFETLLREMNPEQMAQVSVRNHHVFGLDYLCLHRSPKMTVKLYFIDPARLNQKPGEYLVTPHTHRYAFESTVLSGKLAHVRFHEVAGSAFERAEYSPEGRSREACGDTGLYARLEIHHGPMSSYWCSDTDIHTLLVPDRMVLLGLVQFGDTRLKSTVYIKKGGSMDFPQSRAMRPAEAEGLRLQALSLIE
jgi:hypothetical protein